MSAAITVDYSGMDKTFADYLAVTGYTVQKGLLYQLRNWLVRASQMAYGTEAHFISDPDPKLVAFLMSSDIHGGRKGGVRKEYGTQTVGHKWISGRLRKDGSRGRSYWRQLNPDNVEHLIKERTVHYKNGSVRTFAARMTTHARERSALQFYSREEARIFATKHFDMRKRAARFLGAFLGKMKQRINYSSGLGGVGSGGEIPGENKRLGNAVSTALYETQSGVIAGVKVLGVYGYKHATTAAKKVTTEESANRLERLIVRALDDAKVFIIPNMQQKIAEDLQKIAAGRNRMA